jgi:DNA polymerase-4
VKETGLPISFALSINKTVSKSTGEGKPKGHLDIPENQVRAFKPLSIPI